MASSLSPTIAHGGPSSGRASNRTRPYFVSRPIVPCLERSPLACSPVSACVVFAGAIDLFNILGFFYNFMHRPLCSTMNRMAVLDVLDDLVRLRSKRWPTTSSRSRAATSC